MSRPFDPTPLTDAQRQLAARPEHLALARSIAVYYARRCPREAEAIEAAALFGLVLAARAFDPARGFAFAAFATPRIRGEIIDVSRMSMPKGFRRGTDGLQIISLTTVLAPDKGDRDYSPDGLRLSDIIPSDELPVGWELESFDTVTVLSGRLPRQYGAALRAYLTECATANNTVAVGRAMGVHGTRGFQLVRGAEAMLRAGHPDAIL